MKPSVKIKNFLYRRNATLKISIKQIILCGNQSFIEK